jgi:predicted TIM-barrel fold metal-dependent hydrolase
MIFDVHAHIGPWFFAMDTGDAARNRSQLAAYGITVQVVSDSLAVTYDFREGNARLAGVLAQVPELFGYITLNPNYLHECSAELSRWGRADGFVGVKIHPGYTWSAPTTRAMRTLWALIAEYDLPVLLHTYGPEVADLADVLGRHPSLRIIAAHMGGPAWDRAVEVAAETPRLYLEPSCSVIERGKIELAAQRTPDRLLFGTDATLIHPQWSMGMIAEAQLPDAVRRRVLWHNAVELFDIGAPRQQRSCLAGGNT